jgi:23S rRNA pseudouridine1911/1915/1917 synthase
VNAAGIPPVTRHEFSIEADSDVRLDLFIAERLDTSRTRAATLIAAGQVLVSGRAEKASYRARAGDVITVALPAVPVREVLPEQIALPVSYEDEDLLVVDKPAGMVVHPAPGNWSGTVVNALLGRGSSLATGQDATRAGIVHRLDKDTSGLLLVAKTERAHRLLSSAIASRRVIRQYAALVWGHLDVDAMTIDRPLARHPRDRRRMAVVQTGKVARTSLQRLARFDVADLVRAQLHTGRTHQIRVHLSSIGHPVVGDDAYGGGGGRRVVGLPLKRHFLHAAWLRFRHPVTGAAVEVRSPLPADLRESLAAVAHDASLARESDPLDVFGFYRDGP